MIIIPTILVLGAAYYIIRRRKKAAIQTNWRNNFMSKMKQER
jgi:hypothetical protein